jgi:L-threonylcarbamoyladenylate synthase
LPADRPNLDGREHGRPGARGDASAIKAAARALRAGRLVAFPTETVYGLGGVAKDL